jgi:hypothetical protein
MIYAYLFTHMEQTQTQTPVTSSIKKTMSKPRGDSKSKGDMITEKMEGGILVQRYKNMLVDPEKR